MRVCVYGSEDDDGGGERKEEKDKDRQSSHIFPYICTYIHMQLYHTDQVRSPRQLYVQVIVLLILTQDAAFNTGERGGELCGVCMRPHTVMAWTTWTDRQLLPPTK